jgi:hypothetical protein
VFPTSILSLEILILITNELQDLYTASRYGSKELTAKLNTKGFQFDVELIALANYVQNIANRDNDVGDVFILLCFTRAIEAFFNKLTRQNHILNYY